MHRRPATAAAAVNALVVLCLPWVIPALFGPSGSGSVTAYTSGWSHLWAAVERLILWVSLCVPFAALAAWRTWVHAAHWLDGERCWRGILEAGLCAFLIVFAVLAPAIGANWFRRPLVALGYDAVYATLALVVGLAVGVLLQLVAILVLTVWALVERTPSGG